MCIYNKQGHVRIKDFVSVAWVKPSSLIYIIGCCDDSIVNNNVNKPNAANLRYTQKVEAIITLFQPRNLGGGGKVDSEGDG